MDGGGSERRLGGIYFRHFRQPRPSSFRIFDFRQVRCGHGGGSRLQTSIALFEQGLGFGHAVGGQNRQRSWVRSQARANSQRR